jgi:asparagine synthase (glutamine-hydrolysing)
MCGIAGVFRFDGAPVEESTLRRMADLIRHRGPDDEGYFRSGNFGMAHRRLSIIDLAGGHQPMGNEDGRIQVVYNGEIYNFAGIRDRLIRDGHQFQTRCDTEILVHLWEDGSLKFLSELNGIFAFSLWDEKHRRLLLVRDKYGIKPLYVHATPERLAFASEIKPILSLGDFRPAVDYKALSEYFTFMNTLGDRTLFEGVRMIEPGHYMLIDDRGVRTGRYFDLSYSDLYAGTEEDAAAEIERRFTTAVKRQLMSDVPLGSYLSSGLDSTAITLVGAQQVKPFYTFTCGYDMTGVDEKDKASDERFLAEEVARYLATRQYEVLIRADDLPSTFETAVRQIEDPRVGVSYQQIHLSALASQHVKVVLSGTGSDELFGGYLWRYGGLDAPASHDDFLREYYRRWTRFIPDAEKPAFFTPETMRQIGDFSPFDSFRGIIDACPSPSRLEKALYFDVKTFLQGMLIIEDRLSMIHSIELRVPFLDDDLVSFAGSLPESMKISEGRTKYVLRKALERFLPERVFVRKKYGFTPPDYSWFRNRSLDYVRGILYDSRTLDRGYFQRSFIDRVLREYLEEGKDHRFLLWSLMFFEIWNRVFIDQEVKAA